MMKLPVIRGVIDRRVLVNFRVDPLVLGAQLPPPFRPQLFKGFGIAGICLIRLRVSDMSMRHGFQKTTPTASRRNSHG